MRRDEKVAVVAETRERFARASVALVTVNRGLSVAQATRLRRTVRQAGGEYKVIKHTLAKLAIADGRYQCLHAALEGPRALVFGYADAVSVTKALVEFADKNKQIEVEAAGVEGELIGAERIKALATMPSLPELQAQIVQLATAPARRLAATVRRPAARLLGAIETLQDNLAKSGTAG